MSESTMEMFQKLRAMKQTMQAAAFSRYDACYNNSRFIAATDGKDSDYANRLIDTALALCDDTDYTLTYPEIDQWKDDHMALWFLMLFV